MARVRRAAPGAFRLITSKPVSPGGARPFSTAPGVPPCALATARELARGTGTASGPGQPLNFCSRCATGGKSKTSPDGRGARPGRGGDEGGRWVLPISLRPEEPPAGICSFPKWRHDEPTGCEDSAVRSAAARSSEGGLGAREPPFGALVWVLCQQLLQATPPLPPWPRCSGSAPALLWKYITKPLTAAQTPSPPLGPAGTGSEAGDSTGGLLPEPPRAPPEEPPPRRRGWAALRRSRAGDAAAAVLLAALVTARKRAEK